MDAEKIRTDFDEIARLSENGSSGSDRFDKFLVSLVPPAPTRLLDVGCGSGRLSLLLARRGHFVHGLDLSPEMVAKAASLVGEMSGATFSCCNFLDTDFDSAAFDCVVSAATLHHLPLRETIEKMIGLLKPGGRLIIHDLRADSGVLDALRSNLALCHDAVDRLIRTGFPLQPKELRDAWKRHAIGETYLTYAEANSLAARFLPDAQVFYHWLWRYTIVWNKPDHPLS